MDNFVPLAEMIGFKGINADFIPELLPQPDNPVYLTDGDNILIRNGKIEKLKGVGYLNDITAPRGVGADRRILSLHIFENYDQYKRLMAFTPGQVEYLSSDTGYSDIGTVDGSDDSIVSVVNIDNRMVFTLHDDPIVRHWNGITYAELVDSDLIRARFLMKHKTWLFLVRPLQYVDGEWIERYAEVWPSYPGDINSFTEEDRLMVDADGAINGCRHLEDSPIIYFPGSIHRVYLINDTDGFASVPVTDTDGLMCPKTLTGGRGVHFFMSKRGMMGMKLGAVPVPLSWSKFNRLIIDGIDPLYYPKAIARFYEDTALLYVAFPPAGQGDNGTLLIYDTNENELVGRRSLTSLHYSSFGAFEKDLTDLTPDERRSYGVGGIPIIGTSDGYVLEEKYTGYLQLNDTYESGMTLPPVFFGDRHKNKRLMQVDLIIEKDADEDIGFSLEISNEANVTTVTPYTVTGSGNQGVRRYTVYTDVFGKEFRPVLKDVANPYGFKLHGIIYRGYVSTLK
jgi:hypothetical protein